MEKSEHVQDLELQGDFSLRKQDHSRQYVYRTPLVGYTVKTNTTDIQTVDSVDLKTIHQEIR